MANHITIEGVRFSYVNVFQPQPPYNNPNGEPKYSVTILLPKSNTAAKAAIDAAINATIDDAVRSKWGGQRPPQPAVCIHDGDGPRPSDGAAFGEECRGCWIFTASCNAKNPPFVVDRNVQKILDPREVYSGIYGSVSVSFFAYNAGGKKGIGCGLNGIQKVRDGEPLSGSRITAESAFRAIPPEPAQAQAPAAPAWGAPAPAASGWGAPAAGGWPSEGNLPF